MPQLTIYLDEGAQRFIEAAAAETGCSLSKWAREELVKAARAKAEGWPEGFFDLFGSIADSTFVEPAELEWAKDSPRETL
jgi:hypothetical protein